MPAQTYRDQKGAAARLTERGLKTSPKTMQKWRSVGGGPLYQIFNGRAVYTDENLDAWVDEKISIPRRSTSEVPPVQTKLAAAVGDASATAVASADAEPKSGAEQEDAEAA